MLQDEQKSEVNFESSLRRLEAIVSELEADELDLNEALKRYEEGVQLANVCSKMLHDAELKVQELSLDDGED
jgi:exodeoxyribonuclease VII small subunit